MPTKSKLMARQSISICSLCPISSTFWVCLLLAHQPFARGQNGPAGFVTEFVTGFYFVPDFVADNKTMPTGMGMLDIQAQPFNASNITFPEQSVSNAASFANGGISLCMTPQIPSNNDGTQNLNNSGRSLYYQPIRLRNATTNSVLSFSTMFNFWIQTSNPPYTAGDGLAFVMAPDNITTGTFGKYLGWLNSSTNNDPSSHTFAVEFDIFQDWEFEDIDNNHVGININSLTSTFNSTAGFYPDGSEDLSHINMTDDFTKSYVYVWIEYNGSSQVLKVTINVNNNAKPRKPLISTKVDLTSVLNEFMYVGFTAATGDAHMAQHTVYAWSFSTSKEAVNVFGNTTTKPGHHQKSKKVIVITCATIGTFFVLLVVFVMFTAFYCRYKIKKKEGSRRLFNVGSLDPKKYGPCKFSYRDLSNATDKFSEKKKLGKGGFGWVFKGVLPNNTEVAVKRICETSQQGSREFMAEVEIIGKVRHRNLVPLLGWCHDKGELLLVYEYMPNGSLDNIIFRQGISPAATNNAVLTWEQKKKILCGVAMALHFLHEEYDQCVLHRDVKASNVMLDADFNARLGDFGMARPHDHSQKPKITRLAGTLGYMAPDLLRDGQPSEKTDVYSFGILSLEIVTGRQAIAKLPDGKVLIEWVRSLFSLGNIMAAADNSLSYDEKEVELALHTGLLCCHLDPESRPSMGQTLSFLKREAPFPMQKLLEHKPLPMYANSSEHSSTDEALDDSMTYVSAEDTTQLQHSSSLHINDEPCNLAR